MLRQILLSLAHQTIAKMDDETITSPIIGESLEANNYQTNLLTLLNCFFPITI